MSNAPNPVDGIFIEFRFASGARIGTLQTRSSDAWNSRKESRHWGTTCRQGGCREPLIRQEFRDGYQAVKHTRCSRCMGLPSEDLQLTLAGAALAARHVQDIYARHWWHSSKTDLSQGTLVGDCVIHLGSRDAAIHRMLTSAGQDGDLRYLHRMTLNEIALVEYVIIEPADDQIDEYLRCHPLQDSQALRYINRHEAPGDISMVVLGSTVAAQSPEVFHLKQPGGGKVAIHAGPAACMYDVDRAPLNINNVLAVPENR